MKTWFLTFIMLITLTGCKNHLERSDPLSEHVTTKWSTDLSKHVHPNVLMYRLSFCECRYKDSDTKDPETARFSLQLGQCKPDISALNICDDGSIDLGPLYDYPELASNLSIVKELSSEWGVSINSNLKGQYSIQDIAKVLDNGIKTYLESQEDVGVSFTDRIDNLKSWEDGVISSGDSGSL